MPHSPSDLTPAWMTAALSQCCPHAVVEAVQIVEQVDGTNRRASIQLRYARGDGPDRVFVKAQGRILHRLALSALRALYAEVRLFQSRASLPLEHPLVYAAAFDRKRLATIVLMEDVRERGGVPNHAARPLSVEQVRNGLDGLASLHAAYWDRPSALRFLAPWRLSRAYAPISRANLARGLRRLREQGRRELIPDSVGAALLERQFRASATLAARGPQTVLHGDPHIGNTYALPGGLTGFYDWQLVRVGNWCHDVGYFLGSSLDIETRRAHERELIEGYLEALRSQRVSAPDLQTAWSQYRATPAFGLCTWLHTFAARSFQPDSVCLPMIERFCAAYEDLETR